MILAAGEMLTPPVSKPRASGDDPVPWLAAARSST